MNFNQSFAMLGIALCGCVPIPQAPAVADRDSGLFCEAPATNGCKGCQASCVGTKRAVCRPGTDGLVLQEGARPFCYESAECSCK